MDAPAAAYQVPGTDLDHLVLVRLYSYASASDDIPVCWPSADRMAEDMGRPVRTIRRCLARLTASGAISRRPRPDRAMSRGRAWALHPGSVTGGSPCPAGHPVPPVTDPPAHLNMTGGAADHDPPVTQNQQEPTNDPPDPRLRLAAAIDAQTERYESAKRATPPERLGTGTAATPEHQALLDRFGAVVRSWPPGSMERDRVAACRPALPVPHVIESAIAGAGSLGRVVDVCEWAWRAYATGHLTKIGTVDASQALAMAFLGAGRFWQSVLTAHNRAQPRQQRLGEWTPVETESTDIDPQAFDRMLDEMRP
jgi:hypothetical protein